MRGSISFGQATELMLAPAPARGLLLQRLLSEPGHVPTVTIRKWATARTDTAHELSLAEVDTSKVKASMDIPGATAVAAPERAAVLGSRYDVVAQEVVRLPPPRSSAEIEAVQKILVHLQQLLESPASVGRRPAVFNYPAPEHQAGRAVLHTSTTELTCPMCGGLAGELEEKRTIIPYQDSALRVVDGHIACGRCGGALASGAQAQRFVY
jgi:hypothetical protein